MRSYRIVLVNSLLTTDAINRQIRQLETEGYAFVLGGDGANYLLFKKSATPEQDLTGSLQGTARDLSSMG